MSVNTLKELASHIGHHIEVVYYGEKENPVNVAIECHTCNVVLYDFDGEGGIDAGVLNQKILRGVIARKAAKAANTLFEEIDSNHILGAVSDLLRERFRGKKIARHFLEEIMVDLMERFRIDPDDVARQAVNEWWGTFCSRLKSI